MDITPQDNTQPISDDQELAKALAGVLPDSEEADEATGAAGLPGEGLGGGLSFEETPTNALTPPADPVAASDPVEDFAMPELPELPVAPAAPAPSTPISINRTIDGSQLDGIKTQALSELRPLLDHVELPAEEKFDTYLMLIRSTDDASLIEPAHAAARSIADEKKKAESLLEIIKEIDYLSRKDKKTES